MPARVISMGRYLAAGMAYASCYALLRYLSSSHWNLTSGLRVLCLLLVPARYWPALFVAESLPLAYAGWDNHERFGWLWASALAVPPLMLNAPVFAWCRRRVALFRGSEVHVTGMLTYILVGAVLTALINTGTLALMRMPPGETPPVITLHIALDYFLGGYLGALTLVPAFLAFLALRGWAARGRVAWLEALRGDFVRDCVVGVLPPLVLMMWMISRVDHLEVMQVIRMAMFLPAAWLTLRHGWQGAAVGGLLASVATQLTETVVRDPAVIQAQALIAFAVSSLLMVGAKLAGVSRMAPNDGDLMRGLQLAQRGLYQEELRLRQVAESLERLGQSMREGQQRMFERLRPLLPANIEQSYVRHIDHTQREVHRLADTLHPRAWRERGLAATFEDGPLARAAAMAGASYRWELGGSGLESLSPDVHLMLYRQACEILVYLMAREPVRDVRVQIRGGLTHGHRWAVLRISGARATPAQRGKAAPEWSQLVSLLGASGQGLTTIRDRAQIYGGMVHEREDGQRLAVSVLLHDAWQAEPAAASASSTSPLSIQLREPGPATRKVRQI
ncbi:MASE1 domain-containing protein [Dyella solisilvae]|nr:hypothetical protein [Dyella solisilvae]